MEANVSQFLKKEGENSTHFFEIVISFCRQTMKGFATIELLIFATNSIMKLIIIGAGSETMINDVVVKFPIARYLIVPTGLALIIILVLATHSVIKLLAELMYEWSRYNTPYKIMLITTNIILIVFCYLVQAQGGELKIDHVLESKIQAIKSDTTSSSLTQIKANIAMLNTQLANVQQTITEYSELKESRDNNYLNRREDKILLKAQDSQQKFLGQLMELTAKQVIETERISDKNELRIQVLRDKAEEDISRNNGYAGTADIVMFFTTFFIVAFKYRHKKLAPIIVRKEEVEDANEVEEFPSGLRIKTRQEMLPHIEFIDYDWTMHHLLVEYKGKEYYFDIPSFMVTIRTNRGKYDKAVESGKRGVIKNKMDNLLFYENILAKTPLSIAEIEAEFNYSVMNEDWFSTTETASENSIKTVQNQFIPLETA